MRSSLYADAVEYSLAATHETKTPETVWMYERVPEATCTCESGRKEVGQFCVPEILRCFGSRRSHARSTKQRILRGDGMHSREPCSSFSYNASRFVVPHRQLCTSTEVYCSRRGMPTCAMSSMPSRNMYMSERGCYSEKEVRKETYLEALEYSYHL